MAGAQTTPATYCASLGNPSCEVLNVEPGGMGLSGAGGNGVEGDAIFLIKMCLNGKFQTRVVAYASGASYVIYSSSSGKYLYYLQGGGNDASFGDFSHAITWGFLSSWPFNASGSTSRAVDLANSCW